MLLWTCRFVTVALLLLGVNPIGAVAQSSGLVPSPEPSLEREGRVAHTPVDEISGIVRSRWQENVWWVHNDSGDAPRIFAIDSTGSVHMAPWHAGDHAVGAGADSSGKPPWPGVQLGAAAHIDYEDIAVEDSTLYLGDIGNNGNARRDLGIYVLREPFYHDRRTRPVRHLPLRYPDQETVPAQEWHFDAESLFVDDGTLYVLTKHREGQQINSPERGTKLYRLDTEHTDRVNTLTLVDHHDTIPPPTAAALSPNGERLAVLCFGGVWIYARPEGGDRWLSSEPRRIDLPDERTKQAEAVTWDDPHTLRIANEQRDVFVLPLQTEQE
ncbi:hypothetical protein [Salinibacter altiplanensis]|uniref:hypothetical protein n=1 Tax=Salinibacter altiplanensis TaxID=1803181 RepID=UPI001E5954B4|nr:hypothetical protein [Salinibacter altiplanensis]